MNCRYHPEVDSTAYCVSCGDALCADCRRDILGSVYCEKCLGAMVGGGAPEQSSGHSQTSGRASGSNASPAGGATGQTTVSGENPGVAFALGLIPGVGAIYNAEFFKAAIHIIIFGFLISLSDMNGPLRSVFGLMGMGFYFYMPFEAYYTAKKRKLLAEGVDLETPIDRFHQQVGEIENRELWGGVALVVLGMIFLADSFSLLPLGDVLRFWPLLLIGGGVWLVLRHRNQKEDEVPNPGASESAPGDLNDRNDRSDQGSDQ